MKILFAGGGTGGHILPIIAITREMRKIPGGRDIKFFYIGPKDELALVLLSQEGIKVKEVSSGKMRRYLGWKSFYQNLIDLFIKIPVGISQAFSYIFFLSPDLIFSKGGFGSIPGVMGGWLLGVPIFLHESDITPGVSNKFLSKLATTIFVSFPRTEYFNPSKMILSGNPIRRELLEVTKKEAQEFFKLTADRPVILILGGSQGAQRINDKILEILPELLKNFEIIHQTGQRNFNQVRAEAKVVISKDLESLYHIFPFFKEEELKKAYHLADLIISRAGSGTIFEIAAFGKPSILIPLPEAAQNHQVVNAYAYSQNGACQVMEEANFTSHFFLERLKYLFANSEELEKMTKGTREFAKPMAAKTIAEYIISYLKQ